MTRNEIYTVFTALQQKTGMSADAFLDLLTLISKHSDELDCFFKEKIAEVKTMPPEEQNRMDITPIYDGIIEILKKPENLPPEFLFTRRTETLDSFYWVSSEDPKKKLKAYGEEPDGSLTFSKNGNSYKVSPIKSNTGEMESKVLSSINLGTSSKKLVTKIFELATSLSEYENEIVLNVYDYAELNGKTLETEDQKKNFCKKIRADLSTLIRFAIKIDGGETTIVYRYQQLDNNDNYVIKLVPEIVNELRSGRSAVSYVPKCLFKHADKSPNSYPIGLQLNTHMYRTCNQGKLNTIISLDSLLKYAPTIPSISDYEASKRQHHKADIKAKIEKALDENIDIGFLKSWHYKEPGTNGKKYTKEEAEKLNWSEYKKLQIDFTPAIICYEAIDDKKSE